ncbi:AMMECR1 domain-containing protein [Xylariaceae sp. FL0594]|nr:AMMECR1 domain-containing protein [Xylariaceae sp. FL0594]
MATVAHCLYCFESLAAHLEGRSSLSLEEAIELWEKYNKDADAEEVVESSESPALKNTLPSLRRVLDRSSTSSGISTPSSASSLPLSRDTPATSTSSLPTETEEEEEAPSSPITESPLFVTWNLVSPRTGDTSLRGCIGTFEDMELDEGLSSYAITSAIHDTRFNPISKRELPHLEVAVTLLTDFEDCADAMDWELGKHGIRISFRDRGRPYGATYLPDVAPEQGWTKEETIVSLMRKAGWGGSRTRWRDIDVRVVRYQGKKEHLRYPEFKRWRDWVEKNDS